MHVTIGLRELLFIFFCISTLCYFPLNKRRSRYYFKSSIDSRIPLLPLFIIPYFVFYFFKFGSLYYLWNTTVILQFLTSLNIAYFFALLFWYYIPNGVKRVPIEEKSIWARMTNYLYAHDNDTNGFPSGHVFITLIVAYFLALAFPAYFLHVWIVAAFICASTVFTKQHYILDVFGGIIWSSVSITLALYLFSVLVY